jgi:hypothetical protein
MNDNRMQKTTDEDNNGLYEIIELNVSEPIIFHVDRKNQQQTHSEKNKQVILVVPRHIETRRKLKS